MEADINDHNGTLWVGMQGNLNKVVALRKALRETPPSAAGWIWWMDSDTLIVEPATPLPLTKWDGHDVVLWGQRELVEAGNIEGERVRRPAPPTSSHHLDIIQVFSG